MSNAKIGAAVLGGYVLGRTKKAKLALSIGSLLAGRHIRAGQLGGALGRAPLLGGVDERVRGELLSAGKAAATSVMTSSAERLADTLHDRTAALREESAPDEAEEEEAQEEAEEAEDGREKKPAAGGRSGRRTESPSRGGGEGTRRTPRSKESGSKGSGSREGRGGGKDGGAAERPSAERPRRTRRSGDG
ncbi:ABC transporter substrate-binding protein [Streptomyces palmae]|uniref:ABC transporter substrate-binding protein n=1 Tax=Streptomyces palmae TaxID=1701085 RepID=A0A4Z0HK87_9ACTN|nr:ABC transporter substrate-binding protein [Streptomyces palmae]TGB19378.1 ABC transporter substrate-binding protein [Streptomyces palmae]